MRLFLLSCAVFLSIFGEITVNGLHCWTCENADSVEHCDEIGTLEECNPSQSVCGIEVRHNGVWQLSSKLKVFKFCKQASACENVQIQNSKKDWFNTQCNPKFPNSVCRCCCDSDGCNVGDLKCLDYKEPETCFPSHTSPQNGLVHCSNVSNVGSSCQFSCKHGYVMVGQEESVCESKKRWTSAPPTCKPIKCGHVSEIEEGSVDCSRETNIGSVCKFTCNSGYRLIGEPSSTCELKDVSARWSSSGQKCQQMRCPIDLRAPLNGYKSCTNRNHVGSVCTFSCGKDYELVGSQSSTCKDDYEFEDPMWSFETPICKSKKCEPTLTAPKFGRVICSDESFINSVCKFSCDVEYDLIGADKITCAGEVDLSGSRGYYAIGFLDFIGYHPSSAENVVAPAGPLWTNVEPICQRKQCKHLPVIPLHGSMVCKNGKNFGSECFFECDEGYERVGMLYIMCGDREGNAVWDNPAPTCERKRCMFSPVAPSNGFVKCSDSNFIGSQCKFGCDDHHRRVGPMYTTCEKDAFGSASWSSLVTPVCERISCPKLPVVRHGAMECTDKQFVNSECKFSCIVEDYKLSPEDSHTITCQNDTTWSQKPPCCARSCPPYAVMDLIVVLDSSSSIGKKSWKIMIEFVKSIFSLFRVERDATNFGVVRYNNKIDTETKINLNECPDDVEMLKETVSKIPYDGSGTMTGQAMTYVLENMLNAENGNRPKAVDVVFVVTDGRSQDDVAKPAQALRDAGVLTYVLGINPNRGKLDMDQLRDIAGSESNLVVAEKGFKALMTPEFANHIGEQICGDPCERPLY